MRVFVAGATGAVGRLLVPLLVAAGHEVTGTSRTPLALGWAPLYPSWRTGFTALKTT